MVLGVQILKHFRVSSHGKLRKLMALVRFKLTTSGLYVLFWRPKCQRNGVEMTEIR